MTEKILVMGGSFNPPTIGHLRLMQAALDASGAVKGIFVPSPYDYVYRKMCKAKCKEDALNDELRADMLLSMKRYDERIDVDLYEYTREKGQYTFETMEYIQQLYPDSEIMFIVGSDKLRIIPHWHRRKEFLEQFKLLTAKRDGENPLELIEGNELLKEYKDSFELFDAPDDIDEISSSAVRALLKGEDYMQAKAMLTDEVWNLLKDNGKIPALTIGKFRDEYHFLSNFYEADVEYDGIVYKNNEAAFQAQKVLDPEIRKQFAEYNPSKAKSLGRKVDLRPDWEEVKLGLMYEIVKAKFEQNDDLRELLMQTGNKILVEGNNWNDVFWGMSIKTGLGKNHLGKILMRVRAELC